jgi:hypothetical protein
VQRNRRAGALRIEFIERSRDESLGIECVFAAYGADCVERTDRLGRMEWRLPARKQGTPTGGWRPFDIDVIDRRQRSAEALMRTAEGEEDGVYCSGHEES